MLLAGTATPSILLEHQRERPNCSATKQSAEVGISRGVRKRPSISKLLDRTPQPIGVNTVGKSANS